MGGAVAGGDVVLTLASGRSELSVFAPDRRHAGVVVIVGSHAPAMPATTKQASNLVIRALSPLHSQSLGDSANSSRQPRKPATEDDLARAKLWSRSTAPRLDSCQRQTCVMSGSVMDGSDGRSKLTKRDRIVAQCFAVDRA